MALESKPLFHPEVIRQQVRSVSLPERVGDWQPKLQHWADLIASGRADDFKETALLPDFLTDIFCGLLGYTGPAAPADVFTFSRERHVEVDGEVADAVLGRFQKDKEQFVAVLEGKGARDPLDRPFAGRRMSAVDQAYRYAINLPCAKGSSPSFVARTPPSRRTRSFAAFRSCSTVFCSAPFAKTAACCPRNHSSRPSSTAILTIPRGAAGPTAECVVDQNRPARKRAKQGQHGQIEITSRQQQTQRTLRHWLRVEYGIEKLSNKLLAVAELDSDTWVGEVKRIRSKKLLLTAAGFTDQTFSI